MSSALTGDLRRRHIICRPFRDLRQSIARCEKIRIREQDASLNGIAKRAAMKLIHEFRDFALRGNVVDLAVGVVIGTAFGKVVTSLVGDVIMPSIGQLIGGLDLSRYKLVLKEAANGKEEVAVRFGTFAQNIFDFVIIAMAIFVVVRVMNAAKLKQLIAPAASPTATPEDILLLREIRDELRQR